jgi:hypothetical protein
MHIAAFLAKERLFKENIVFRAIILKKLSLSIKKCLKRKMRGRLKSIKGCISSFHIYFFARIVFLIQGTILS